MNLSKSLYTRGLQCIKSLWLKKYKKDILRTPNSSQQVILSTGDKVGDLACKLFPKGKEIPYDGTTFEEKISLTKKWIDDGLTNIYEATFEYGGILMMVDILHINDDDSVEIYEVKSSTSVKDVYFDDASIQYYVLNGLGYDVAKTNIVHINSSYVRDDKLEIDKLFTIADVSDIILELQLNIPKHLKKFETILAKKSEPNIDIGKYCSYPYDCDAMNYCWKYIPEYSIFDITRLKTDKKFKMYQDGIVNFNQIKNIEEFSQSQQIQIQAEQQNKIIINKQAIRSFLDSLTYPIYHLDFETFAPAIPLWKNTTPFMQIPFQYSLHIESENKDLEHKEFLAVQGIDPRYKLAKRLIEDIPDDVTVLACNIGFEKGVIKKLANMFDEFSDHLMKIHNNIQDLMIPFQKKYYYTPKMKGSYSIKYVLPALVPDMTKAYKELNYVKNGADAMRVYSLLANKKDKEEVARLREALLRYCELDTLAMVMILKKLNISVK